MAERYPLHWPEGWPRTVPHKRTWSNFRVSHNRAQDNLMAEIRRLGGRNVILSTNIRLRQDGLPYASQRPPEDPGVAVYFEYKKRPMVFACDRWAMVGDNIHSIGKTIEALRGIERWGASDMLERAFTGFEALPEPPKDWRAVLNCSADVTFEAARQRYLSLRSEHHPDRGGDSEMFQRIQEAWEHAKREFGDA